MNLNTRRNLHDYSWKTLQRRHRRLRRRFKRTRLYTFIIDFLHNWWCYFPPLVPFDVNVTCLRKDIFLSRELKKKISCSFMKFICKNKAFVLTYCEHIHLSHRLKFFIVTLILETDSTTMFCVSASWEIPIYLSLNPSPHFPSSLTFTPVHFKFKSFLQ